MDSERRLRSELARVVLRLDRIVRILSMALEIAGCCGRAFTADDDPDYLALISRVIFKEVRMRDGKIVAGTLSEPLAFFRQWTAEKPLGDLVDLALIGPPTSTLVEGCKSEPQRHASLSKMQADLLWLQEILAPEQESEIESCFYELRGRGVLDTSPK